MRFIDAEELKRNIRWNYHPKEGFRPEDTLDECAKLDSIIDYTQEINPLDRDIGKEPKLEETVTTYHETRADGKSGFRQSTTTDWHCPNCGYFVGELYSGYGRWHIQGEKSYCSRCGQKIDWELPKAEEKRRYERIRAREREKWLKGNGHMLDNMNEGKRRKYGLLQEETDNDKA